MNEKALNDFGNGKKVALTLGGLVYVGVVLLFMAFFETLMASRFEGLLGVIARIGAFLVAGNAIALPVALHYWTVTGSHRWAAIVFYGGDVLLMGLNVMAAAAGESAPTWLNTYTTFSPASIVFVLFGWALLFMTDPGQRALVKLMETVSDAQVEIVKRVVEYVGSDEGVEKVIQPMAERLAAKVLDRRTLLGVGRPLQTAVDADAPSLQDQVTAILAEEAKLNGKSSKVAEKIMATIQKANPT